MKSCISDFVLCWIQHLLEIKLSLCGDIDVILAKEEIDHRVVERLASDKKAAGHIKGSIKGGQWKKLNQYIRHGEIITPNGYTEEIVQLT